jgi:transcriptional regulator with XRE-family HTH domain
MEIRYQGKVERSEEPDFGEFLRRLRQGARKSLRAVSEEAEISLAYLAHVEAGKRNPPGPDFLRRLARSYGVPPVELFHRAGYLLPEDSVDLNVNELRRAYEFVISDPRLSGLPLARRTTPGVMRAVVEFYEMVTGKRLLREEPAVTDPNQLMNTLLRIGERLTGQRIPVQFADLPPLLGADNGAEPSHRKPSRQTRRRKKTQKPPERGGAEPPP